MINSTSEKKKKTKDLALKVYIDKNNLDIEDEEVALLSPKFKWFLIRRKESITKASKHESGDVMKCYKYRKLGNMMASCLLLKRKPNKSNERKRYVLELCILLFLKEAVLKCPKLEKA